MKQSFIFNCMFTNNECANHVSTLFWWKWITSHKNFVWSISDIGDGLIEVIGLENCLHMGQVKTGLRASGRRLAQCSNIVIRTRKRFPMQVDGEPWMQSPCTVSKMITSFFGFYCHLNHRQRCVYRFKSLRRIKCPCWWLHHLRGARASSVFSSDTDSTKKIPLKTHKDGNTQKCAHNTNQTCITPPLIIAS